MIIQCNFNANILKQQPSYNILFSSVMKES